MESGGGELFHRWVRVNHHHHHQHHRREAPPYERDGCRRIHTRDRRALCQCGPFILSSLPISGGCVGSGGVEMGVEEEGVRAISPPAASNNAAASAPCSAAAALAKLKEEEKKIQVVSEGRGDESDASETSFPLPEKRRRDGESVSPSLDKIPWLMEILVPRRTHQPTSATILTLPLLLTALEAKRKRWPRSSLGYESTLFLSTVHRFDFYVELRTSDPRGNFSFFTFRSLSFRISRWLSYSSSNWSLTCVSFLSLDRELISN